MKPATRKIQKYVLPCVYIVAFYWACCTGSARLLGAVLILYLYFAAFAAYREHAAREEMPPFMPHAIAALFSLLLFCLSALLYYFQGKGFWLSHCVFNVILFNCAYYIKIMYLSRLHRRREKTRAGEPPAGDSPAATNRGETAWYKKP
ncbi:MAG: hypothetical protein LBF09_01170 [Odoribacteraceae bacterium]|jgi:uncharacterized membrane protein|nr:hypothetical protein [Odoribacteraceae bacterium]